MWSYYGKHKGICIGLNMDKTRKYLSEMLGQPMIGCEEVEVQYKDIVKKPDYFRDVKDFFHYQLSTKAKAWAHEQEVRQFILNPWPTYMKLMQGQTDEKGPIDWKEMRAYLRIGGECFDSVYLGIDMDTDEKAKIIKVARNLNPDINIYQMAIDSRAFKLNAERIE